MSRSKPQGGGSNSPIKFRFSFSGKTGEIKYYDKEAKEDVFLSDLKFVILDRRSSITGFNDDENTSVYSNMVRNLKSDEITARAGSKTLATGLYSDLKPKLDTFGGKFTTNVLLLAEMDGKWEMGNLQLTGSSLSAWMDFEQGKDERGEAEGKPDLEASIITISKGANRKKGAVKYVVPTFNTEAITKKLDALAMEQDILLQDYFDGVEVKEEEPKVPERSGRKNLAKGETKKEEEEEDHDDLPF